MWRAIGRTASLLTSCALVACASVADPGSADVALRQAEERFASLLSAERMRASLQELTVRPHHTGSPGAHQVVEALAAKFQAWGYETRVENYYALISSPREQIVELLTPRRYRASLSEPPIPGHTPEEVGGSLPPHNVYSADGDVKAPVIYVNYGLPEDYEVLKARGISAKGKIVLARYGRAYRGVKPRVAAAHGAVGAILFSDPADYGSGRGETYPNGPFLPLEGYQRGSVLDITRFTGDPLTPSKGSATRPVSYSVKDAAGAISPIPVLPVSAKDVQPILEALTGPEVPEWRGGLPIKYRIGGNAKVRLKVLQDWSITELQNVVATLRGSTWPDEWVLRGNNHDAWNYGALVAGSGFVAMLEEARAIGELAKAGWRPKRTIVYLAWDGEEQGLLGSTEWAETHAAELREKAVAYINSGINTRGTLNAGGSHVLENLVNDVARSVAAPSGEGSVHDRAAAVLLASGEQSDHQHFKATGRLPLVALGLGSDFTPFLQHLGIASLDYSFEGEAESGVYHSIYDNFDFYDRFGDPGYRHGVKLAEVAGRTVLRLASTDVIAVDFTGVAEAIKRYVGELQGLAADGGAVDVGLAALKETASAVAAGALRYRQASERLSAGPRPPSGILADLNRELRRSEQLLAPEHGLPGRPWFRHYLYAPGTYTGYGVKTLPSVREALEAKQWAAASHEVSRAAAVLRAYAAHIEHCAELAERASGVRS